ncbi:MAG: efflux RND transporter periplasmic adaptor subunit [Thermoanaerobaculia bacterium]
MRRRLIGAVLGVAGVVIAGALAIGAGGANITIPTHRVQKAPYVRSVTAEGNLTAARATPVTAPSDAEMALKLGWIAEDGSPVKKGDVVARFDSTDFEKELLEGRRQLDRAENRVEGSEAMRDATKTNLGRDAWIAERELDAARMFQKKDAGIYSRFELIESEIDESLAVEKKEFAEEMLSVRARLFGAEREILGIEERKADYRIDQAEKALSALEVRAPHDGILVLRRNWRGEMPRVGDMVWRGNPLGEIPDLEAMKVEAFVLEADAGGIAEGQEAVVIVESHPREEFAAKVEKVDPIAKNRFRGSPVQYFGVTLALDRTDPEIMKPGARVRATITLEKSESAISIPRQAIFEKNGKRIVWVRRGEEFEPVEVELGSTSIGAALVTKGLAEGDVIALEEPRRESAR